MSKKNTKPQIQQCAHGADLGNCMVCYNAPIQITSDRKDGKIVVSNSTKSSALRQLYTVPLEIRKYNINGCIFYLRLDRVERTVTFVKPVKKMDEYLEYKPTQFVFKNRGLEFMNGWEKIMEGMLAVVAEARIELEAELAERSNLTEEMILHASKGVV